MESNFFDLYSRQGCLVLEVGHNSGSDWCIVIYDRKGKTISECATPEIHIQSTDRKKAFAEAYTQLCDYLSETRGGH